MPTEWPQYSLLPLAIAVGWILPLGIPWLWHRIASKNKGRSLLTGAGSSSHSELRSLFQPVSVRFHRAALLFPVFLGLVLMVSPMFFAFKSPFAARAGGILLVVALLSLVLVFYCLGKGDLSWTASRTKDDDETGRLDL